MFQGVFFALQPGRVRGCSYNLVHLSHAPRGQSASIGVATTVDERWGGVVFDRENVVV